MGIHKICQLGEDSSAARLGLGEGTGLAILQVAATVLHIPAKVGGVRLDGGGTSGKSIDRLKNCPSRPG